MTHERVSGFCAFCEFIYIETLQKHEYNELIKLLEIIYCYCLFLFLLLNFKMFEKNLIFVIKILLFIEPVRSCLFDVYFIGSLVNNLQNFTRIAQMIVRGLYYYSPYYIWLFQFHQ